MAAELWSGDGLFSVNLQHASNRAGSPDHVRVDGDVIIESSAGTMDARTGSFTAILLRGVDGKFRMNSFKYLIVSSTSLCDGW